MALNELSNVNENDAFCPILHCATPQKQTQSENTACKEICWLGGHVKMAALMKSPSFGGSLQALW